MMVSFNAQHQLITARKTCLVFIQVKAVQIAIKFSEDIAQNKQVKVAY